MSNNHILGIETSTLHCSVAIFTNGQLVANRLLTEDGSHSKMLTLLIQEVCEESQISLNELDAIAVSIGPGSYTGLRIGLSTAKGICYALDKPLIAIPTLHILTEAAKLQYSSNYFCPMLDARRMEVYTCLLDQQGNELVQTQAKILSNESFIEIEHPVVCFGNGSSKWESICQNKNFIFSSDYNYPNAIFMGKLAHEAFLNERFENLVLIEPQYLKEFVGTKPKTSI